MPVAAGCVGRLQLCSDTSDSVPRPNIAAQLDPHDFTELKDPYPPCARARFRLQYGRSYTYATHDSSPVGDPESQNLTMEAVSSRAERVPLPWLTATLRTKTEEQWWTEQRCENQLRAVGQSIVRNTRVQGQAYVFVPIVLVLGRRQG